jgi:thiamine pyrophosphokinase
VIVVVGGDAPDQRLAAHLPAGAAVICADSGLDHAIALGLAPTLVVGDLDSVSAEALQQARRAGVPVDQHPSDKDATDTELALARAMALGHDHLVMVGGGGRDRLDHTLGALTALGHPSMATCRTVEAWWGPAHVTVLHGPRSAGICGTVGETISLLPVTGPCTGVTTDGLRWALADAALSATSSRGVSNLFVATPARVTVDDGVLFVIRPDALASPADPQPVEPGGAP